MRMRYLVGFWLGIAGSLLIVVLLFAFGPSIKRAYRTALASQATLQAASAADDQPNVDGRPAAGQSILQAQPRAQATFPVTPSPDITPRRNPTPNTIPNTGGQASSQLPTLVYLLLIAAVLLLTSELLVVTRPRDK